MQCGGITDNSSDDGGHIPPSPQQQKAMQEHEHQKQKLEKEQSTDTEEQSTEEELVVAMGNAAKAARRVGLQQQRLRTTGASFAKAEPETTDDDHSSVVGDIMGRNTTAYYVNGYDEDDDADGEVCYTSPSTTTTTTTTATITAEFAAKEKKNETCTLYDSDSSNIPATTTTTCTTTTRDDGAVVVDEDDYVVGNYDEEEDRAYKTSGAATLSQSEHIVQQQQQQRRAEQGLNALISNVSLFLDQTWNWLHYFLVTIIFLNLVHFANRRASVVGEARSVVGEVEGATVEDEEQSNNSCVESEESGNIITKNCTSVIDDSALFENSISAEITMSPNTCSIQNQQEVEKAEEAIMAVGVPTAGEKAEAATEAPVAAKPVEEVSQVKQQQITIILPNDEQIVISGEDASSDDNNSENNDLAGIRRDSVDSYTSSEGSGNLGDVETEICDKSSEDGASVSSSSIADENTGKQIAEKIISQVEAMFSDEHLSKDGFLLKHVRRRSDGFVSLKLVAGLRKVKQISREFPVVLDALKDSTKLEINSEGTKVRRVEPLTSFLKSVPIKSKEKEKDSKGSSSNDENQLPNATIQNNKSKSGNKENGNENGNNKQGGGNNQSRRNSNANNGNQSRRNSNAQGANSHHRKSSNTSTASSNTSSRHNSFSKAPGIPSSSAHPADLFRNVYMAAYSSSGEDSPQAGRRRGGSLPIAALHRASQNSGAYLSPNSSPPNGTLIIGPNGARPKSNSYCEGASPTTMSPWLQRRKASASSRLSNGELTFNGVIRQPRGPDGTKGFASGYRAMILEERLQQQQNSAVSA